MAAPLDTNGNAVVAGQQYVQVATARHIDTTNAKAQLVTEGFAERIGTGEALKVSDVATVASVQTLANKTLDATCAIQDAKGHRFWVHLAASDLNSGLTQVVVPIGGIDSITYPHAMMRACKIVRASVVAMHADATSPPATWILDVFKNGVSASTFTFNLSGSFFVDAVTHGAPSAASWAAGDTWGVKVRGTSLDAIVARIAIEFETTI